jgi:hypothetical protein
MRRGILSHNRVRNLQHQSVAMEEIQDRRAKVTVPGGRKLHEYVNLYICARNPMMYKRKAQYKELCVLRISPEIINLSDVVITDGNASGDYVRFAAAPNGLSVVDRERTFADDWRDVDMIQYFRKKAAKCAEVLVPDCVNPNHLLDAYVGCQESMGIIQAQEIDISVTINSHIFFR